MYFDNLFQSLKLYCYYIFIRNSRIVGYYCIDYIFKPYFMSLSSCFIIFFFSSSPPTHWKFTRAPPSPWFQCWRNGLFPSHGWQNFFGFRTLIKRLNRIVIVCLNKSPRGTRRKLYVMEYDSNRRAAAVKRTPTLFIRVAVFGGAL